MHGTVHRMTANTTPEVYNKLWKPLWLFLWELRVNGYPWGFIYRVFTSMQILKLPIVHEYFATFQEMWAELLEEINNRRKYESSGVQP
jgi:hypothetical protein